MTSLIKWKEGGIGGQRDVWAKGSQLITRCLLVARARRTISMMQQSRSGLWCETHLYRLNVLTNWVLAVMLQSGSAAFDTSRKQNDWNTETYFSRGGGLHSGQKEIPLSALSDLLPGYSYTRPRANLLLWRREAVSWYQNIDISEINYNLQRPTGPALNFFEVEVLENLDLLKRINR